MIKINELSISFSGQKVVDCPHIQFEEGQVHGIAGLNGAGKTTFFNLLSGYLKPDTGDILREDKRLSLTEVGYLETTNFFYSNLTGKEYLDIFPASNHQFKLENLNQIMQLPLNGLIEGYSTGMKKKLALLAVLKQDKAIYILDEPFNGVDLETTKVLELIIARLKARGKTVFISSHILSPLITVCDKIYFLQQGVFTKTFEKQEFGRVEAELYGEFTERASGLLEGAV